ncbi:hypothetical protein E2C01_081409 [Portunus trituberculatus]|uniref:Uncharacterized protein n=1 Tax=Portunus trituberculatus TaxID=210409 RepID=A0A5B7IVS5_PORTR|nr:hypothetical protein [Portunus trituberculatus]
MTVAKITVMLYLCFTIIRYPCVYLVASFSVATSRYVQGTVFSRRRYHQMCAAVRVSRGQGVSARSPTLPDPEDKPPTYDQILKLDGAPPDYFSILTEKPPR